MSPISSCSEPFATYAPGPPGIGIGDKAVFTPRFVPRIAVAAGVYRSLFDVHRAQIGFLDVLTLLRLPEIRSSR